MERLVRVALILLILGIPHIALGDSQYFEFLPDYGGSLLIATAPQPVEQVFLPLNDHVSSVDMWLSNDSTAGNITATLYAPGGTQLSSRVIAVPSIADGSGGTRINLPLVSQVPTTANEPHTLRISTSVPSMRLYHATQRNILTHNAVSQAAYTGGLARLGGNDEIFAFMFALYENSESTAPVLSNLTAIVESVESVRIALNASEPVDITVDYGPQGGPPYTLPYADQYTACPNGLGPCTVFLDIHDPGAVHDFTLTARDAWGNTAQVEGTFTSAGISIAPTPTPAPSATSTPAPTPDTAPPVISNARAVNVTHNTAGIAWTTDEAANSLIVVQFGIDNITVGGGSDSTLELEHLIPVTGLAQQTTYTARVTSGDATGNETVTTFDFTTGLPPTPSPGTPTPSPSGTSTPTPTVSVGPTDDGGDGSTAQWEAPTGGAPANGYRIDIIGADGKLINSIHTNDTSADLGDLPDGARIIVYADHGDGIFEKVAAPNEIQKKTPGLKSLLADLPLILGALGGAVIIAALLWKRFRIAPPAPTVPAEPTPESDRFTSSR